MYWLKGTSVGCITDFDGNFTLTTTEANPVNSNYSYVGYKTQEIAAKEQSVINLMMESDFSTGRRGCCNCLGY